MNIYLIRHGTTGVQERSQKESDKLNLRGVSQAQGLADRLASEAESFHVLISSPLMRAQQTADIISKSVDLPVTLDARLTEIPLWLSPEDLHNDSSAEYQEGLRVLHDAQSKSKQLLHELYATYGDKKNAILVCHGNIIRAILCYALKMNLEAVVRLHLDNASVSVIRHAFGPNGFSYYRLYLFNSTKHLG